MTDLGDGLRGKVVLLTEDDAVLASNLTFLLQDCGAEVDGPKRYLRDALVALAARTPDAAILDVELLDGEVFPVSDRLKALGVPFVFYTAKGSRGYEQAQIDGAPIMSKSRGSDEPIRRLMREIERRRRAG